MESKGYVQMTPAPLPNKHRWMKQVYWGFLALTIIGLFADFWQVCLCGVVMWYLVDCCASDWRDKRLRFKEFKFVETSYDDVFEKIQPILISKYNNAFMIERGDDGRIIFSYDKIEYDFTTNKNGTFSLWWHMSWSKAFASVFEYRTYRKNLIAMGILAYEIQALYGIQNQNANVV